MGGKAALIVIDSVGIGELPDSPAYGDEGSDTLGHIYSLTPDFRLANLESLGLCHIQGTSLPQNRKPPIGAYGKMKECSEGKDSTTGHWEIAGLIVNEAFATFPVGFPDELIREFTDKTGFGVLCNRPYSGTEVIKAYGAEHMQTRKLIVYTSADSVFQIAAHEKIVPLKELYRVCEITRRMLDKYRVARVIARPFLGGSPKDFTRTPNRRDFSMLPSKPTLLDVLSQSGMPVVAIGKISDLFAGKGITNAVHTETNAQGIQETLKAIKELDNGLIFTNLVDFDQLYGHRNNVAGYAAALKEFDESLPRYIEAMGESDLLVITADHGNDPSTPSTDHSREYVPILAYQKGMRPVDLGIRSSFSDVAATLADFFSMPPVWKGTSFFPDISYT
ncbi:MAG: phosphopentomutase [Eubacteriaceae bacterium]|jgi:phosphopentomutase|nr:phosphopentomutase [Eubacteriaceae bacterium]